MKQITTLAEASAVLEAAWPGRGVKHRMSLDYMRELMDYLGNPQDSYKVIHIAGTSGKTSTAYYAAALLTAAGHVTGLTVSPHVDTVNERTQINMHPLPEAVYVAEMNTFIALIKKSDLQPTYFELLYAFAFWEFARQRVEYAVVEVGVGGTLDNTNVITRSDKVSVLTDIGFDHMHLLGNTLSEIASQKAGIIPAHGTVFCWRQSSEVLDVFRSVARQKQADLHILDTPQLGVQYAFLPLFQRRNFELSQAAVAYVLERDGYDPVSAEAAITAAQTVIPARMQTVEYKGKTIVLDGSHNPQKLQALATSVRDKFPGIPITIITGFARSTSLEHRTEVGMRELIPIAEHIVITGFTVNRAHPHPSADPEAAAATCRAEGYANFEVIEDPALAFTAALKRPEQVIVVTGSFYLLNAIRPLLGSAIR